MQIYLYLENKEKDKGKAVEGKIAASQLKIGLNISANATFFQIF